MSHYRHLSMWERESLQEYRREGKSIREIGRQMKRSASTISRELKRNGYQAVGGRQAYRPYVAYNRYLRRRMSCRRRKVFDDRTLWEKVVKHITQDRWSPEQISNRLRIEGSPYRVSYATIYRALRVADYETEEALKRARNITFHLRHRGKKRRKDGRIDNRGHFPIVHHLSERCKAANERREVGHWEADTIMGKPGTGCILVLVDRKTRYTLAAKLPDKTASTTADAMCRLLSQLPEQLVKSVTPDRGSEFYFHSRVTQKVHDVPFYFPQPHAPWLRPTSENTNGLIRQYIPKRKDFQKVSNDDVFDFLLALNLRPRKCLGWKSPHEAIFNRSLHLT